MFTEHFRQYASEGDSIDYRVTVAGLATGLRFVATLYRDESGEGPEERSDGFWPSLDPQSAGYIGPKSEATLKRHTAKAQAVLDAWNNDEWFYCGVAVRAFFDDEPLTGEYGAALWGVDCNYPQHYGQGRPRGWYPNHYLREVANEQLSECVPEALERLRELVESGLESAE